jgi:tryptophan synthase alpha chain
MLTGKLEGNRLYCRFKELASENRPALICYIVAGYPTLGHTKEIVSSLVKAGVDIIEIGIPFTDPIADGPTIQRASNIALKNGATPQKCLDLCGAVRESFPDLPLVIMTYSNIVFRAGIEEFLRMSKSRGVDGLILPDLEIAESHHYVNTASKLNMATVFLASPNTNVCRIRQILTVCSGFLYVVSVYGTTGSRSKYEDYTFKSIRRIKEITGRRIPVAVGFGISRPNHVTSLISSGADAVIVGSAIIEKITVSAKNRLVLDDVRAFIGPLRAACTRATITRKKQ